MPRLRVQGLRDEIGLRRQTLPPDVADIVKAKTKDAVSIETSRSSAGAYVTENVEPDDVVEVVLDDGSTLWLRGDRVEAELNSRPVRGMSDQDDIVDVPAALPMQSAQRGFAGAVINAIRVHVVDTAANLTARELAERLEARTVPKPGLYKWRAGSTDEPAGGLAGADPILLFLHGTGSSTLGSFDKLQPHSALWRSLTDRYPNRMVGLEHHTLSVSPFRNAIDCLEALPANPRLHVVSHSRGGLVGELLCRARLLGRDEPFDPAERDLFKGTGLEDDVEKLGRLLREKRPTVERFVRVACPARGTTLAGERLDRWLSILLNLIGLTPGLSSSPTYALLKSFLLAVVKQRADPRTIPGLEAMIPDSRFQKLINRPGVVSEANLSVIKGDLEGEGLFGRLKTLATDFFYREDHDLVVNTSSMDGGTARRTTPRLLFDQGPNVNHFRYFENKLTADRLLSELLRPDADPDARTADAKSRGVADETGLVQFAPASAPVRRGSVKTRGGSQPVVFVLPGITGSLLSADGDEVWIDVPDLALGGLKKLAIDAPRVEATGMVGRYYRDLVTYLSATHEVIPFPYDWRLPIRKEAERFADALRERLNDTKSVGIVAHSMGGLVARGAFAIDDRLWSAFRARRDSRLVMLGTPNDGSYSIPLLLMGREQTMKMLALLDFTMNSADHLEIVSRFPGVLDLLPRDATFDFHDASFWKKLQAADRRGEWSLPKVEDLKAAAEFRRTLANAPVDGERMVYVAGQRVTLDGVVLDERNGKVSFSRTHRGDGQVLWSTGIPQGVRAWYANCAHGDLARHKPAFPAILDLLRTGTTSQLPTQPSLPRDLAPPEPIQSDRVETFPTADDLAAAGLGAQPPGPEPVAPTPIRIRVVHGNLGFARFPLLVGHYQGDTLAGAEAHIDRMIGGRLSRWRALGLYPGPVGTAEVILDRADERRGAVVVGLGSVGDLTVGSLRRSITRGLLRYAAFQNDPGRTPAPGSADRPQPLKLSALPIGTGQGGVSIAGGMNALLQALAVAQTTLAEASAQTPGARRGGYDELEIFELYEHRAIQTWHEIHHLLERPDMQDIFRLDDAVRSGAGGRRRIDLADDKTWWQPVTVVMEPTTPGADEVMRFTVPTSTARAEAIVLPTHKRFVDSFIEQAVAGRATDRGLGTPGRTLFELLVPRQLKDQLREDRAIRLILDATTAAYPWELLDDRRPYGDVDGGVAGSQKPPAIRAGMIRQLQRQSFFERPARPAQPGKALVIANPKIAGGRYADLPFAAKEGREVADLLAQRGFKVSSLIETDSAEDIVSAICAQDWQIVHIAAHGTSGGDKEPMGVVIGDGLILTADMLGQLLPLTPDLVFLNCCHLGSIDDTKDAERTSLAGSPSLAANLAVKLIDLGVRAVVAAGWAVDDLGADIFAHTFYRELLDSARPDTLGGATLKARQDVYDAVPDVTWGAYQVYGEPDWRILQNSATVSDEKPTFASPVELIDALERLWEASHAAEFPSAASGRTPLAALVAEAERREWTGQAAVATALGRAFAAFGDIEKAIQYLRDAARCDPAGASVTTLEQLAHLTVRDAMEKWTAERAAASSAANTAGVGQKWADVCREMIDLLNRLDVLTFGETKPGSGVPAASTVERHVLRGGCYKRLARIDAAGRVAHLKSMADCYQAAHAIADPKKSISYMLIQRLSAELAERIVSGPGSRLQQSTKDLLTQAKILTDTARDNQEADFWTLAALGDVMVLQVLADGKAAPDAVDKIVERYDQAWRRGGNRLELASVSEHFAFLIDVLSGGKAPKIQRLVETFVELRARLDARTKN